MSHKNRHDYFKSRLKALGAYDSDSDYAGEIGKVVEAMSEEFSKYGHSGSSAIITLALFNQLMTEWLTQDLH